MARITLLLPLLASVMAVGACSLGGPYTISGLKCQMSREEACLATARALQALSAVPPSAAENGVRTASYGRVVAKVTDTGHNGTLSISILPEDRQPYVVLQAFIDRQDDGKLTALVSHWKGNDVPEIVKPLMDSIEMAARNAKSPDLDSIYLVTAKEYRESVIRAASGKRP